jgi:DNA-binding response OmpR family regulator
MPESILLVEDEPWLGELYQKQLIQCGYKVTWCQDGYEAIDSIDICQPKLIVLDLLLPWANGIQLLHELASHGDLASIPVIIYSNALPSSADQLALRRYGVKAVLDKASITPKQLVAMVGKVLTSHAQPNLAD